MTAPDQYRPEYADRVCVDCGRRGPLEYVVVFEGQDHIETWWPTSHVGRGWSHPPCAMRARHRAAYGFRLPRRKGDRPEPFCEACQVKWPCDDARDIYREDEL